MDLKLIAIDTSKHIFTLHGIDERGHPLLRREIKRDQMEGFFRKLSVTEVALEACGGLITGADVAGHGASGPVVPPQYVKPFVKRSKNDRNDAEAIAEAASRPSMRAVAVKSIEQQAKSIIVKHRELLVGQRS